ALRESLIAAGIELTLVQEQLLSAFMEVLPPPARGQTVEAPEWVTMLHLPWRPTGPLQGDYVDVESLEFEDPHLLFKMRGLPEAAIRQELAIRYEASKGL